MTQPNLPASTPQFVDVSGADLESKLAELRAQGAHIQRMDAVDKPVGSFNVTVLPSKTTCANCLTIFRTETRGRLGYFRVKHTDRFNP